MRPERFKMMIACYKPVYRERYGARGARERRCWRAENKCGPRGKEKTKDLGLRDDKSASAKPQVGRTRKLPKGRSEPGAHRQSGSKEAMQPSTNGDSSKESCGGAVDPPPRARRIPPKERVERPHLPAPPQRQRRAGSQGED